MARYITRSDGKTVDLEKEEAEQIDLLVKARANIPIEHHMVHKGKYFFVTDYDSDVDIATPKYWHIKSPNSTTRIHLVIMLTTDLAAVIEFFESPTTTDDGTQLTAYNADRNSTNTPTATFYYDPTVSADGTLLQKDRLGTDKPPSRLGGHIRNATEFILKQNTAYLVKISPESDNTKISLNIEFYEVS